MLKHLLGTVLCIGVFSATIVAQDYQRIDGLNNNMTNPEMGASHTRFRTMVSNGYGDGISTPGGVDRPNPRLISNELFNQLENTEDHMKLSDFFWSFGQFIDHDIVLSEPSNEFFPVPIPAGDPFFDPLGTGNIILPLMRSQFDPLTGTGPDNPRVHMNSITSWIDGSAVYGSNMEMAQWLRTFSNGKLKVSEGDLLPFNTYSGKLNDAIDPEAPHMELAGGPLSRWYVAGDVRANEHPLLSTMHTLFVREHNRVAEQMSVEHPDWNDEQLYQYARAYVAGIIQRIAMEEWLPAMGIELPEYSGYDPNRNASISNIFSVAAYRMGHTLINEEMHRLEANGQPHQEGDLDIASAFFNPFILGSTGGVEPYLRGMASQMQQKLDCHMIGGLRNFLFGPPGSGGLDLASLNIQRGRERGLPDFNTVREDYGMSRFASFEEICSDEATNNTMAALYGDVENIDPWVGMLAEDPMDNMLFGTTIHAIVKEQFQALRDGDRFFYLNHPMLSEEHKEEIHETMFSEVIRRNTNIEMIQDDVFQMKPFVELIQPEDRDLALVIWPNPATTSSNLAINADREGNARLYMIDMLGRTMLRQEVYLYRGVNYFPIELEHSWPNGIYHIGVRQGNREEFIKLVKN